MPLYRDINRFFQCGPGLVQVGREAGCNLATHCLRSHSRSVRSFISKIAFFFSLYVLDIPEFWPAGRRCTPLQ
jgi:hypothetical protein